MIFASISVTAACFAVTIQNAIHGILYLILVFLNIACILLLKMDFFALCLITVYIGAVAILFIFVIMMINLKIKETSIKFFFFNNFFWKIILIFLINIFFTFIFLNNFSYLNHNFFELKYNILQTFWYFSWTSIIFNISNIELLGNLLYSEYYLHFILASILLFIAMIASIILTMQKSKLIYRQHYSIQISKQLNKTIYNIEYLKMDLNKNNLDFNKYMIQRAVFYLNNPNQFKPITLKKKIKVLMKKIYYKPIYFFNNKFYITNILTEKKKINISLFQKIKNISILKIKFIIKKIDNNEIYAENFNKIFDIFFLSGKK
jgi:NADH-quinone oxidoreductase subunit J